MEKLQYGDGVLKMDDFFISSHCLCLACLQVEKKYLIGMILTNAFGLKYSLFQVLFFVPLFFIQKHILNLISSKAILDSIKTIETSWTNISFMLVLMSGFVLLFHSKHVHKKLDIFSPMGRMSLSNYIFQSIIGASIYYGFGLGLYKYTGASFSLIIGILCSILLIYFSKWWLKNHKRGPFETVWHKLTWLYSKNSEKGNFHILNQNPNH